MGAVLVLVVVAATFVPVLMVMLMVMVMMAAAVRTMFVCVVVACFPVVVVMVVFLLFVGMRFVAVFLMGRAGVDAEKHAFDLLPFGTVGVEVKVAEAELAQFPLEGGRPHAEVEQRAHGHVAADAAEAVEIESFAHGVVERSVSSASATFPS
jgi:uncharacterized paraquat-inducible protein A